MNKSWFALFFVRICNKVNGVTRKAGSESGGLKY